MKRLVIVSFLVGIIWSAVAQNVLFNPYVEEGIVTPQPLLPAEFSGSATLNFDVGNTGSSPIPSVENQEMSMVISLSNGIPATENPLLSIGGTWSYLFNWFYDAGSNSYTAVQNQEIPANAMGTISIMYLVSGSSSTNMASNGFNVNLQPPPFCNGFNITSDDAENAYTYTQAKDFGDAPLSYGSAGHEIKVLKDADGNYTNYVFLGTTVDYESGYQASSDANGDDSNMSDDDDGVQFPLMYVGSTVTIPVTVTVHDLSYGYLNAWIDWNADGDFGDFGEKIAGPIAVYESGIINVTVNIPASAVISTPTFARFRFGNNTGVSGFATNSWGEVEDYQLIIYGTGASHEVDIPSSACSMLSNGDFIGIFYDSLGTYACGGYTIWNGSSTTLTVTGETGLNANNGFYPGEEFHWLVWKTGMSQAYPAMVSYNYDYPQDSLYVPGGSSGILSLTPYTAIDSQIIDLRQGWGMISTYIIPQDPTLSTVFQQVSQQLIIMKDGAGNVYWPEYGYNGIGQVHTGDGYLVKMLSQQNLIVYGYQIAPEFTPLNLPALWSIMGYLRTSPASAETILNPIVNLVSLVKDEDGYVYWPIMGLNTMANMYPGKAYLIKLSEPVTFTYPANGYIAKSLNNNTNCKYFVLGFVTGQNMILGIPKEAWQVKPVSGDEIGIFSSSGLLCGRAVYQNDNLSIAIWGDDETTNERDGMTTGEQFEIRLWRAGSDQIETITVTLWVMGYDSYTGNGIAIAGKISGVSEQYSLVLGQNTPNPFRDETIIPFQLPEDANIRLSILNALGEEVMILTEGWYLAGMHEIVMKSGNLLPGVYFYRLVTGEIEVVKSLEVIQ